MQRTRAGSTSTDDRGRVEAARGSGRPAATRSRVPTRRVARSIGRSTTGSPDPRCGGALPRAAEAVQPLAAQGPHAPPQAPRRAPAERPGRRSAICPFGPRSPSRTGAAGARTSSTASRPAATTRRSRSSSSVRTPPSTPCNTPQRAAGFSVPLALQGLFGGRRRRGPIAQPPHTAPAGYGGRALKCNARIVDSRDVGGMLPPRNLTSGDVPARA